MQIDRSKIYGMPLILGPVRENRLRNVYTHVETIMLEFETDPDAIPPLLPEPFKPGKSPTVTVLFGEYNGVDFLAGGGYRFAAISVAAQCDGKDGHLEGSYVLVLPENNVTPIITGREWLGMPKVYADLSSIRIMEDGHLRCEASMWGHLLFGIDIAPPFKEQNALACKVASNMLSKTPTFGYKYIASLDGPPDADYPTIMWIETTLKHLWLGKSGELYTGSLTPQDIGDYKPTFDALKSIPVRKVTQTSHSLGSMVLRNDKNGRIR